MTIPKTTKKQRVQLHEGYDHKNQQLPDAKLHQIISFIKSTIRIIGYAFIPYSLETATILLIFSEFIGIIEELV